MNAISLLKIAFYGYITMAQSGGLYTALAYALPTAMAVSVLLEMKRGQ